MQVYYFTRTGRSENIAKKLAEKHGTTAIKISDDKNWKGAINFMKAGAMASKKQKTDIKYNKNSNNDDKIALVFPVWAGNLPPAIRTFLEDFDRKNIIAIPTSLGTTLRDRDGFAKIIDLIGKEISLDEEIL